MIDTNILLVDDDTDTCDSMSDVFLDLGYTVDTAHDGASAVELSGGHHYLLAFLDYNMPGMDGLELCRRLKIMQPNIVVALITGFTSITTTGEAAEAGIRCSFLKPVDFSLLIPLVEKIVGNFVSRRSSEGANTC
ncbi:Sporulation initiation phosphotransferase F [Anatilimnocola aggregata]|uniref:Sporulation initiation phosphotransferase F n=1 Tax=Anatilimnocola aggregata TaxID=2528021 RepID=A0A517YFP2_9BACT|nr:response regulator [Anatilimnocola aggregata]QDU29044.1 Sporulation initiation phosphotransferase F [Anatilimnocola aggregata]